MARVMVLTLDGREYRCTSEGLTELTIKEAREIKRHTGMRIASWGRALSEMDEADPDAFLGLAYLLVTRSGGVFNWSSLDDMQLFELMGCFKTVDEPDADEAKEPVTGEVPVVAKAPRNGRVKQPAAVTS